jgi:hypothetical protein
MAKAKRRIDARPLHLSAVQNAFFDGGVLYLNAERGPERVCLSMGMPTAIRVLQIIRGAFDDESQVLAFRRQDADSALGVEAKNQSGKESDHER